MIRKLIKVVAYRPPPPPRLGFERTQHYCVTLTPSLRVKAREIGGGNVSAGVRRALADYGTERLGRMRDIDESKERPRK